MYHIQLPYTIIQHNNYTQRQNYNRGNNNKSYDDITTYNDNTTSIISPTASTDSMSSQLSPSINNTDSISRHSSISDNETHNQQHNSVSQKHTHNNIDYSFDNLTIHSSDQWSTECINRGLQWLRILRPDRLRKRFSPGTFGKLARQYESLNDYPIRKDLSRTYPNHTLFITSIDNNGYNDNIEYNDDNSHTGAGRPILYNILRAYSSYDTSIGYSQGLAFIAGFLIQHIPNAEICFYSFIILMLYPQYNIRWLYENECNNLQTMFSAFSRMLLLHTPRLYQHFSNENIIPSMYATQWFLTCFTYRINYNFTATLWDNITLNSQIIRYNGRNKYINTVHNGYLLIRILQVATAIMKYFENYLCKLSFDMIIPFLNNPPALDVQLIRLSQTLLVPQSVQSLFHDVLHNNQYTSLHTQLRNKVLQQHSSSTTTAATPQHNNNNNSYNRRKSNHRRHTGSGGNNTRSLLNNNSSIK